jgi:small subunit ribosomal protein S3Ae
MDLIHDKMCSMVKKWQTMTEAPVDVKTASGLSASSMLGWFY